MAFAFNDKSGKYAVLDGCAPQDGGGYTFSSEVEFESPMEAVANFFGRAEMRMRRKIRNRLENRDGGLYR